MLSPQREHSYITPNNKFTEKFVFIRRGTMREINENRAGKGTRTK